MNIDELLKLHNSIERDSMLLQNLQRSKIVGYLVSDPDKDVQTLETGFPIRFNNPPYTITSSTSPYYTTYCITPPDYTTVSCDSLTTNQPTSRIIF